MSVRRRTSWPALFGALAAFPGIPLLVLTGAILVSIGQFFDSVGEEVPGSLGTVGVVLVVLLQVFVAAGSVTLYWAPRFRDLTLDDGRLARPVGFGVLAYLAMWPVAAVLGLASAPGQASGLVYLLTGGCLVFVLPAMLDHLIVRRLLGGATKVHRG